MGATVRNGLPCLDTGRIRPLTYRKVTNRQVRGGGDAGKSRPLLPGAGGAVLMHLFSRSDKWYLGGGDRLLWAPPFPVWLRHPGLWDEVSYFNHAIFPCFTWTLLDGRGRPYSLRRSRLKWSPAGMSASLKTAVFPLHGAPLVETAGEEFAGEVTAWENLALTEDDRLCAEITIDGDAEAWEGGLHLVAWTAQPDTGGLYVLPDGRETKAADFAAGQWGIVWTRILMPPGQPQVEIRCRLSLDREASSWSVQFSEGRQIQPHWGLTPWSGVWERPGLGSDVRQSGNDPHGIYYAALHAELARGAGGRESLTVVFEVPGETGKDAVESEQVTIGAEAVRNPPGWVGEAEPAEETPPEDLQENGPQPGPPGWEAPGLLLSRTARAWEKAMSGVPEFRCSDPFLEAAWKHRWYALRLLEGRGGHGYWQYPAVCEGIGYFRMPVSYSGHAQMRDLRWRHDPSAARGTLRNFVANQHEDGSFPGRIYHNTDRKTDFYLADWGGALLALEQVHPDPAFCEEVYEPLSRYAEYFDRERDREDSGLYDVVSHYETGQEYMSRYMAVFSEADRPGWVSNIQLKAVDATVYIYRLKRALAIVAGKIGREGEVERWNSEADKTAAAVLEYMWDPEEHWFSDVDPRGMERTGVKAAVGFYPFMTDLAGAEQMPALWEHLLDPEKFWTPFPVPATSADDPWFDPDARWKGKRMNCPWNGRVWPMTNSHVLEALARAAWVFDFGLAPHAAHFLTRYVRMLFTGGDPGRPNTFEHYHPYSGQPCFYRGIDDYMHSWLADLILRFAVGLQPPLLELAMGDYALSHHPLDLGLEYLTCRSLLYRGHLIDVELARGQAQVSVDGRVVAEGPWGEPLEVPIY